MKEELRKNLLAAGQDAVVDYIWELESKIAELTKSKPQPIGYIGINTVKTLQHPGTNYDLIYRESGSVHGVAVYLGTESTCNFVQREGRCDGMLWDECTTCGSTYKNLCKLKPETDDG